MRFSKYCRECERVYRSQDAWDQHNAQKHNIFYKCRGEQCDERFVLWWTLNGHEEATHPYECRNCYSVLLSTEEDLEAHESNCHNHRCSKCHRNFSSGSALNMHLEAKGHRLGRRRENNESMLVSQPPLPPVFQQQIVPSPPQEPIVPPSQNYYAAFFATLDSEELTSHDQTFHTLKSNQSTVTYESAADLEVRSLSVHEYICICSRKFPTESLLVEHHLLDHVFPCNKCSAKLDSLSNYQRHMDERHQFVCTKCPSIFDEATKLSDHHCDFHAFRCEHCRIKFDFAATLQDHISEFHHFSCDTCNSGIFVSSAALAAHKISAHTARCTLCKVMYSSDSVLEEHIRMHHTFPCDKCPGANFENAHALTNHHTTVHNINCGKCQKLFVDVHQYLEHYHRAYFVKCQACNAVVDGVEELAEHQNAVHKN